MKMPLFGLLAAGALFLAACSSTPPNAPDSDQDYGPATAPDLSHLQDPEPRDEPRSRYGNPESYEVFGQTYRVMAEMPDDHSEEGIASWYGKKFHGRRTSSGEPYDMYTLTAAHRELPIPAYVRVTHLENGRSVVVRVNDRGPFAHNRIIDLSYAAAQRLDMVDTGTAPVRIDVLRDRDADQARSEKPAPERKAARQSRPSSAAQAAPARRLPGEVSVNAPVRYYLQVGAFSQRDNAENLRRTLVDAGLGAVQIQGDDNDSSPLYRVRVGPVDSVEEVDRLSRELQQRGLESSRVAINP
ncbi:MAG: septal ring lytic transglycosylase RlpA family protein [Aquisalimonadaceae bacterium]